MVGYLLVVVPALVNVAFLTLLERKILGYVQLRKGPNKVRFAGLLQPFADAVKLFLKESTFPETGNFLLFLVAPWSGLFLALTVWRLVPLREGALGIAFSSVLLLILLRFGVYSVLGAGWASNRKYATIGGLRGVAQTVSYEVSLALFLFRVLLVPLSLSIGAVQASNLDVRVCLILAPLAALWFISCLAETNRTPFDFAEGERELVSGFNVEYGRGGFVLIFMAEYAMILFLRVITSSLFWAGEAESPVLYLGLVALRGVWIWARATLPRYRYDKLIGLAWKRFLPVSLHFAALVSGVLLWVR